MPPGALGVGEEDLRREHEHEPVPSRERPLEVGLVAAGVLEHRPLVDHRQLEVRVRVVDGLPAGLGDDDEREGDGSEGERRRRPRVAAGRARDHAAEVGRAGDERRDGQGEDERRFDEHRQRQVAARALEREAVRRVPGRHADGESREREQAREHERVVADTEPRRAGGDRDEEDRRAHRRCHETRGQAVDERRALDVDAALAPEAAELAVRAGAGPDPRRPWRRALACWVSADQERGEGDATDDLCQRRR